ncbi:uncharacterized protein LTR77_006591 [Saxophila tyrrhenica]|uniref:DUF2293 domain-containing protein n=1 Tax=Saxophila tyrrhenica TaxID=1690608 RepID=A0AAV9P5Z4_9PEZI|nr:hypothetical protein LTR77_006591 [Saxophila tyrrhenica]
MTNARHNTSHSRAGSARPGQGARNILKRRDNHGLKVETTMVLAPKKKFQLSNTFTRTPPQGFIFVPFGSGPLTDRCTEISMKESATAYKVQSNHRHAYAAQEDRVSSQVHRIGHHFKAEIVLQACEQLGYLYHNGCFERESEIAARNNRTPLSRVMATHGIRMADNPPGELDRITAMMREMFPKMPEAEIEKVINRAWEAGTGRVGTSKDVSMTRRVQLAVLSHIRHQHTDYDYLLRAFGWERARREVEPYSVKIIKEWQGENAQDDDSELEWCKREVFVIPDDDDEEDEDEDEEDKIHAETIIIPDDDDEAVINTPVAHAYPRYTAPPPPHPAQPPHVNHLHQFGPARPAPQWIDPGGRLIRRIQTPPPQPPQQATRYVAVTANEPYPNAVPSIEDRRGGVAFSGPQLRWPGPPRPGVHYIDLTSPERRYPVPQPIHGAPAPVQQLPRGARPLY